MAKTVLCYLGLHRWQRLKTPYGGGWYKHRRNCGKDGDDDSYPPLSPLGGINQSGGV
jgi:hypothetical protein